MEQVLGWQEWRDLNDALSKAVDEAWMLVGREGALVGGLVGAGVQPDLTSVARASRVLRAVQAVARGRNALALALEGSVSPQEGTNVCSPARDMGGSEEGL